MTAAVRYTARYADDDSIVYAARPQGNLIGELPLGAQPIPGQCGTFDRRDGGDPWERAVFVCRSGRQIVITRDGGT